MTASSHANTRYPCPDCIYTGLPGVTQTWPRPDAVIGTGKVWAPWSGAAMANPPPAQLVTCYRCAGTGLVADRRRAATDRRKSWGRREMDDPVGSNFVGGVPYLPSEPNP